MAAQLLVTWWCWCSLTLLAQWPLWAFPSWRWACAQPVPCRQPIEDQNNMRKIDRQIHTLFVWVGPLAFFAFELRTGVNSFPLSSESEMDVTTYRWPTGSEYKMNMHEMWHVLTVFTWPRFLFSNGGWTDNTSSSLSPPTMESSWMRPWLSFAFSFKPSLSPLMRGRNVVTLSHFDSAT